MILLRKIRYQRGISQVKLSQMTGIPQAEISLMENQWRRPFPVWQRRIAKALEIPASEAYKLFESVDDDGLSSVWPAKKTKKKVVAKNQEGR